MTENEDEDGWHTVQRRRSSNKENANSNSNNKERVPSKSDSASSVAKATANSTLPAAEEPKGKKSSNSKSRRGKPSPSQAAPPHDLNTLQGKVKGAREGTGEIPKIFDEATFTPGAPAYTSIIKMCGEAYQWSKAMEVFEQMKLNGVEPNTITYSALINTCGRCKNAEKALEVYEDMKRRGIKANAFTYSSLISACARGQKLSRAIEVFDDVHEAGIEVDSVTYSAMISACERGKRPAKALEVFQEMREKNLDANTITFNSMLNSCSKSDEEHCRKAFKVFKQMKQSSAIPDGNTYACMITASQRLGHVEWAADLVEEARGRSVKLDAGAYTSVVRMLGEKGDLLRALELHAESQRWGYEIGEKAVEALMEAVKKNGWWDEAINMALREKSQKGVSSNAEIMKVCLRANERNGRSEGATECFEVLLKKGEVTSKERNLLARIYATQGSIDMACDLLSRKEGGEDSRRMIEASTVDCVTANASSSGRDKETEEGGGKRDANVVAWNAMARSMTGPKGRKGMEERQGEGVSAKEGGGEEKTRRALEMYKEFRREREREEGEKAKQEEKVEIGTLRRLEEYAMEKNEGKGMREVVNGIAEAGEKVTLEEAVAAMEEREGEEEERIMKKALEETERKEREEVKERVERRCNEVVKRSKDRQVAEKMKKEMDRVGIQVKAEGGRGKADGFNGRLALDKNAQSFFPSSMKKSGA